MKDTYDALMFGKEKHKGQLDDDGNDYFAAHCLQVQDILECLNCSTNVVIAGMLHDTLEDTDTTYDELREEFGKEVADLVLEVTQEGKKDEYGYYFPRLQSKDAILIKFADRLSNLSRMESWDIKRQHQYLRKSKFWKSEKNDGSKNG